VEEYTEDLNDNGNEGLLPESWACILGILWGQVATRTRSVTSAYFRRVSKSACDKNWLYSTPTK